MAQYLTKVRDTLNQLNEWVVKRIPRTEKIQVDVLAGVAATLPVKEAILLLVHLQSTSSIAITPVCRARQEGTKWMCEIENYLRTRDLPEDSKHAHKVQMQAARFTLIGDCLYKRSFEGLYLICLDSTEAQYVLAELHEGICNNHTGGRSLAHHAHSQGYYWPTMKQDVEGYVKKCDRYQRRAPIPRMPSKVLNPITNPWPFAQ